MWPARHQDLGPLTTTQSSFSVLLPHSNSSRTPLQSNNESHSHAVVSVCPTCQQQVFASPDLNSSPLRASFLNPENNQFRTSPELFGPEYGAGLQSCKDPSFNIFQGDPDQFETAVTSNESDYGFAGQISFLEDWDANQVALTQ